MPSLIPSSIPSSTPSLIQPTPPSKIHSSVPSSMFSSMPSSKLSRSPTSFCTYAANAHECGRITNPPCHWDGDSCEPTTTPSLMPSFVHSPEPSSSYIPSSEPNSMPSLMPSPSPTPGCLSLNYKDCVPDTFSVGSCDNTYFLSSGAVENCTALGEGCTNGATEGCCLGLSCINYPGEVFGACVPPIPPTSSPV
eukprot:5846963-Ditylum_brightwellii.AAC.1